MWLVELDIFDSSEELRLLKALDELSISYRTFRGHEFQQDAAFLCDIQVFRGSCWFISQVMETSCWPASLLGTFEDFRQSVYRHRWMPWLLNRVAECWPLVELAWNQEAIWSRFADNAGRVFLRPDDGFKSFTGSLVADEQFGEWYAARQAFYLPGNTPIIAAKPVKIHAEYRCFLCDGRVIAASRYQPTISPDVGSDVVAWIEEAHRQSGEPLRIYAADIAMTEDGFRVVEIGCVPCLDFYDASLNVLVPWLNQSLDNS